MGAMCQLIRVRPTRRSDASREPPQARGIRRNFRAETIPLVRRNAVRLENRCRPAATTETVAAATLGIPVRRQQQPVTRTRGRPTLVEPTPTNRFYLRARLPEGTSFFRLSGMLVTPLTGVNRADVLETLHGIASDVLTAENASDSAYNRLTIYLQLATRSVRMLEHRVTAADVNRLVLTRGYERLLSLAGNLTGGDVGTQGVLNGMLSLEIRERTRVLEDAISDLDQQIRRWSGDSIFTVADTNIYMGLEQRLEDADFAPLLPGWADKTVRVIVPIIVLDELDGLTSMFRVADVLA